MREQRAFQELAQALIFERPSPIALSRKTVPELSRRIQDESFAQDEEHEGAKQRHMHELIERALKDIKAIVPGLDEVESPTPEPKPRYVEELLGPQKEDETPTEAFKRVTQMYLAVRKLDDSSGYGAWGFTPKIAGMHTRESVFEIGNDGKNCFGAVQSLGALYARMGLKFDMGLTADHPFAVVEVEGKTYLASLFGVHEAKGEFEERDGYREYRPSPEDEIPYKLMTVWNFDEALVYELLENFEALRQMSLGTKVHNLPGTYESGMKIASEHTGVLQAISWSRLQEKVTPRLAAYFREHKDMWKNEIETRHFDREAIYLTVRALRSACTETSLKDETPESFNKKFLALAKPHRDAIVGYMSSDAQFGAGVPDDVASFFRELRAQVEHVENPALREAVRKYVLRPFTSEEVER